MPDTAFRYADLLPSDADDPPYRLDLVAQGARDPAVRLRAPHSPGSPWVRVLVAFEDVRGVYREAIARALAELRPALEVRQAPLAEIRRELRSFDPHVVVCSRKNGEHPGGRGAWVQVPTEDGADNDERLAQLCLDGVRWDTEGPTLCEILHVVDEARRRLREGRLSGAC